MPPSASAFHRCEQRGSGAFDRALRARAERRWHSLPAHLTKVRRHCLVAWHRVRCVARDGRETRPSARRHSGQAAHSPGDHQARAVHSPFREQVPPEPLQPCVQALWRSSVAAPRHAHHPCHAHPSTPAGAVKLITRKIGHEPPVSEADLANFEEMKAAMEDHAKMPQVRVPAAEHTASSASPTLPHVCTGQEGKRCVRAATHFGARVWVVGGRGSGIRGRGEAQEELSRDEVCVAVLAAEAVQCVLRRKVSVPSDAHSDRRTAALPTSRRKKRGRTSFPRQYMAQSDRTSPSQP